MWFSGGRGGGLGLLGLELGGAEVADAGVSAAGVVPALDVVEDRGVGGGSGGPRPAVDQFLLDGGEERLADRVVPALTPPSDGQPDAEIRCGSGELADVYWQPRSE